VVIACKEWTLRQVTDTQTNLVPLRCKQWTCPPCAETNARLLRRRLKDTAVTHLITLTCRPAHFASPYQAFRHLSAQVPNLIKRIKRSLPAVTIQYLLVWETTRRGWPHAHILARTSYLPQRLLSRHWQQLTGAPVVDIRAVTDDRGPAHYLTKYLTKHLDAPPGLKRYRTSRLFWPSPGGLLGPPPPSAFPWKVVHLRLRHVLLDYPSLLWWRRPLPPYGLQLVPRSPPAHSPLATVDLQPVH